MSVSALALRTASSAGERLVDYFIRAAEAGWLPDRALRIGIREVCRARLRELSGDPENQMATLQAFAESMRTAPVAVDTSAANDQHYEVSADFYKSVLGPHLKYSSAYWGPQCTELGAAEAEAIARTCDNADLRDGQRVLELGCGWGSLTLAMAKRYPASEIVAISNSASQRRHVLARAAGAGLDNVTVETVDINVFQPNDKFDRVVSVEMFEHLRNHAELFKRVASWLHDEGRVKAHVFCSRDGAYTFQDNDASDWMARHFFTGGMMPSDDLFLRYQDDLVVERQWRWSGTHYQKTADAWLVRLHANKADVLDILKADGAPEPTVAFHRWRMFFIACSELFGYDNGRRWWVSHYRWRKR